MMKAGPGGPIISGVEYMAVRLYAAGKTRNQVANILAARLSRGANVLEAKRRLRRWEETQWFRDAVYDYSIREADMELPQILLGMKKKARTRVDAARFVFEVTGRHNPRGETAAPSVVQINFGGALPRPISRAQLEDGSVVDGEIVDED